MKVSSRYAVSTEGRVIYVALKLIFCQDCKLPIIARQLFTRGLPGQAAAVVCYDCRPFEVDEVSPNWQGSDRPEVDHIEI